MATNLISIPRTLTAMKKELGGIERLLTAKRWEKAAIVYAWTENSGRGRPAKVNGGNPPFTLTEFAELGITGLKDRHQVAMYRKAWEDAAAEIGNDDMLEIQPGDAVDEPKLEWKEFFGEPTVEVQERVARAAIIKNPGLVREAIEAHPAVAEVVIEHVAGDRTMRSEIEDRAFAKEREIPSYRSPVSPPERDPSEAHNQAVREAIYSLTKELRLEAEGAWTMEGLTVTVLELLNITLKKREDDNSPSIFDEIDAHLAATV